jgi:hypothetical protein
MEEDVPYCWDVRGKNIDRYRPIVGQYRGNYPVKPIRFSLF